MLESIDRCEAPVVCRVHGHAVGGALGLVAAADVALASEDAVFGFPEVRLRIVPAVISPFVLARIGEGPARRYFLTGERFGAFEALRIGLVHEVQQTSMQPLSGCWTRCSQQGRRRFGPRNGSCWTRLSATPRQSGSRTAAPAARVRRACKRSSSDARPTGFSPIERVGTHWSRD